MKLEKDTYAFLSAFLPDALLNALASYERFARQPIPDEAREFTAHHSACKVAISHIELLIKLSERTIEHADENDQKDHKKALIDAISRAQDEISGYKRIPVLRAQEDEDMDDTI
jgi:hypothetical protein